MIGAFTGGGELGLGGKAGALAEAESEFEIMPSVEGSMSSFDLSNSKGSM